MLLLKEIWFPGDKLPIWTLFDIWCLLMLGFTCVLPLLRNRRALLFRVRRRTRPHCLCKHTKGTHKGPIIHTQRTSGELNNEQQTPNFQWNQFRPYANWQKDQFTFRHFSLLSGAQSCRHTHLKYLGRLSQYTDPRLLVCWGAPATPAPNPRPFSLCSPPPLLLSWRLFVSPANPESCHSVCHLGRRSQPCTVV